LKYPATRPETEGASKLFITTLAGPFVLGLNINALPPLKNSQQTHKSTVPVRISPES